MKKVLLACLCALITLLASCSSDNEGEPKKIRISNEKELNQTLYADEQTGGISFVAEDDWTTTISENVATKSAVSWITLNPDHGTKGSYTISINLEPNLTGKKRTATITIVCGDTKITVTVTQEGTTESGEVPETNYLVSRIVRVHETVVAATGTKETDTETYTYTYDNQNRIIKVREDETLENGKMEYLEETYTYKDNTITSKTSSSYDNDEVDKAVYILGEDGNIATYEILETEAGTSSWKNKGTLSYDKDGHLSIATMKVADSSSGNEDEEDRAVWKDGNLVKVYDDYYGSGQKDTYSEMSYENPEYVNNQSINLDLNYVVCDTEWLDCFAFGGRYIKPYGHIGKRSKNYMTKEYDGYHGDHCIYEYKFDEKGLPVQVVKKRYYAKDNYFSKDELTYTITYQAAQ